MTTTSDKALALLNDLAERMDDDAVSTLDAVHELADAGLLAPDLPKPDRNGLWWPKARRISSVRRVRDHVVWEGFEGRRYGVHVGNAVEFGLMIQAAADYAEKESQ